MLRYLTVLVFIFFYGCIDQNNTIKENISQAKEKTPILTLDSNKINNTSPSFSYGIPMDSLYSINFLEEEKTTKEIRNKNCGKNKFIIRYYKLVDLENASDPVLNVLLIFNLENIIYKTVIAAAQTSDANLFEVNNDPCYLGIKYFSSPVGYYEYYIYDLDGRIVWKTQKLDELEELGEDAFNMLKKEYSIKGKPTPLKLEMAEKF